MFGFAAFDIAPTDGEVVKAGGGQFPPTSRFVVEAFGTVMIGLALDLQGIALFAVQHEVDAPFDAPGIAERNLGFQVAQAVQTAQRGKDALDKLPFRPVFILFVGFARIELVVLEIGLGGRKDRGTVHIQVRQPRQEIAGYRAPVAVGEMLAAYIIELGGWIKDAFTVGGRLFGGNGQHGIPQMQGERAERFLSVRVQQGATTEEVA